MAFAGTPRPRTPTAPGSSGLGEALGQFAAAGQRRRERGQEKRRNLLYYQAADGFQGSYNDALVSGELDELDAAGLQEKTNEWIEEWGEGLREHPDLREKWEAGQRSKVGALIAAKVEEQRKSAQADMLGGLISRREEARSQISDALRVASASDTPGSVRAAKFAEVQAYHDELALTYEGLGPVERARAMSEDNAWMREEQFRAVTSRHAHEGTLLDFTSRMRNSTDWVDEDAKSGPRWSEGLDVNTRQSILNDAWAEQSRVVRAAENVRAARVAGAKDYRRNVGQGIIDQVVSGELSLADGRTMMRERGWVTGQYGEVDLDRQYRAALTARGEADDLLVSGDRHVQEMLDDQHAVLTAMNEEQARAGIAEMRGLARNGSITQDQFNSYKAAAEDRMDLLRERRASGDRRQQAMLQASDEQKKAFLAESGIYVGIGMEQVASEMMTGKDMVQEGKAQAVQVAADVEAWLISEEATPDVARDAWQMARAVLKSARQEIDVDAFVMGETGQAGEEAGRGDRMSFWMKPIAWWVDDAWASGEDDDVESAPPPKPKLVGVQTRQVGAGLVTALNRMSEAGHPVDTHREFFSLMPLGEDKLYLRFDEAGALDAAATLDAMESAPEMTEMDAAVKYLEVFAPLAQAAESTRGWRSGTARAKDELDWMRAKGVAE